MKPSDFFRALRRRKFLILGLVLLGAAVGYVTAPGESDEPPVLVSETTMLGPSGRGAGLNLEQAALLVTTGEVPDLVADELDMRPAAVRDQVRAQADDTDTFTIVVSGLSTDPERAEALSSTSAAKLIEYFDDQRAEEYNARLVRLGENVDEAVEQLEVLEFLANEDDFISPDERKSIAGAQAQLNGVVAELQDVEEQGPPGTPLSIIETSPARELSADGISAPEGKPERTLFLGAFGLILGLGATVVLEQLDTRIRSRADAERAFGLPVIGDIPPRGRKVGDDELLSITDPASPVVEAYRSIRTSLLLHSPGPNGSGPRGLAVLVTSALPAEGKTTSAAELAVLFAEVGKRVLFVSADLRRPRAHKLFDAPSGPGMLELFDPGRTDVTTLRSIVRRTAVDGVDLIPSGRPTENPAPHLAKVARIIQGARNLYDVVLIDTAPLLAANDANELIQHSDTLLMMVRTGKTSEEAALHAMGSLDLPAEENGGVVMLTGSEGSSPYSYRYRYRYRYQADETGEPVAPRRRRPWSRAAPAARQTEGERISVSG